MSQWRWYVWCKTVKASKKRTKVLWSYQCPQYPVVQSAVVLIFAWLELESKNKHLFISLCGDVHIYVGNFFFAVSIAWNRGRARNILKETLALYVKHQIWKAELLTIEKAHISRNSLPKVLQASDSRWLKTCGRPQYLSRPKRRRWYFCQILTVRTFQFGKTCNAELLRFWVRKTSKSLLNLQNNGTTSAPWWWR